MIKDSCHRSSLPAGVFYNKSCSQKFRKIHSKTPVPLDYFVELLLAGIAIFIPCFLQHVVGVCCKINLSRHNFFNKNTFVEEFPNGGSGVVRGDRKYTEILLHQEPYLLAIVSLLLLHFRTCHQRCSLKKCVLRNFAKFTGKHLSQNLFLNKVAGPVSVFSCEFCEIFKNTFFTEHSCETASDAI